MKKTAVLILVLLLLGGIHYHTNANLSYKEKKKIDGVVTQIEKKINKKNIRLKDQYILTVEKVLNKVKKDSKQYQILEYLLQKLKQVNIGGLANKHYKKYNINIDKVRNYWIYLHNQERSNRRLNLYSYNDKLNNTAYQWSYSMGEKGAMDHKRFSNSGYYDYHTIENWFQQRGVNCKVINGLTTSESIAKHSFYCNSGDCTDTLNKALKEIFDVYMDEEGMSYPANAHFRGITHPDISKLGIGLFIEKTPNQKKWKDFYDFYVTTHYCSEFKN